MKTEGGDSKLFPGELLHVADICLLNPPTFQNTAEVSRAIVRAGVSEVLNIEDHPKNNMLLEILTILPLLPPVLLVFFLMRAASQTLTMYHLAQFACLFCAGYSGLLITAAMLTGIATDNLCKQLVCQLQLSGIQDSRRDLEYKHVCWSVLL